MCNRASVTERDTFSCVRSVIINLAAVGSTRELTGIVSLSTLLPIWHHNQAWHFRLVKVLAGLSAAAPFL